MVKHLTDMDLDTLADRRKDPQYSQILGHVKKETAKRLKFYCLEHDTTITKVVEEAIEEYLAKYDNGDRE